MYPNQPGQLPPPQSQPTQPASLDYLNEISTQTPVKMINPLMIWGLIGGFLLLLGAVVFFALNSGGPTYTERLSAFTQRVDTLKTLADKSKPNIGSSTLQTANSSLSLTLTNTSRDAQTILGTGKDAKANAKSPQVAALKKEFTQLEARLEDGRLNNLFDRTYSREVTYQIAQLRSEMKIISQSTNSKKVRDFIATTETNLAPLAEQFGAFNES